MSISEDGPHYMLKYASVLWLLGTGGLVHADGSADKNSSDSATPWISTPQCSLPVAGAKSLESKSPTPPGWCGALADESDAIQLCIDAQTGCIAWSRNALESASARLILPPNRDVIVIVHSDGGEEDDISDVSVTLAGAVGLVLPVTYGDVRPLNSQEYAYVIGAPPSAAVCVPQKRSYFARFGPRGTGPLSLTATILHDQKAAAGECERARTLAAARGKQSETKATEQHCASCKKNEKKDANATAEHSQPATGQDEGQNTGAPNPSDDAPWDKMVSRLPLIGSDGSASPGTASCHWAICSINLVPPLPPPPKPPTSPNEVPKGKIFRYELYVPKVFGGALRIGFGAIHVDGLAHAYGIRKVNGADFSQIVDGGADPVSAELVVGYAPFLFDKFRTARGRTYTPNENAWSRFAPFFGVGVLSSSPSASKPEFLRSFYFGLEYELTPGSSLALAAVVRRVDALASGLAVGMTVDSGASITRTTFDVGWGVVFNVTPGFFQFANSALPK